MQHLAFQWHPKTTVQFPFSNTNVSDTSTNNNTINDLQFISDENCQHCFSHLELAVKKQIEFCVYPFDRILNGKSEFYISNSMPCFQSVSAGTYGNPKRVRRTQQSWLKSFQVNADTFQINDNDSYAILGRLSHSLPLYAALEAANLGADIHVLSELRPDQQLQELAHMESTVIYATPTQLRMLCKQYQKKRDNIVKILTTRLIFSGGGKLDSSTAASVKKIFVNAKVFEFYGATETSFITISDVQTPEGSVGKAYPNVYIKIEKVDDEANLAGGEIWVKSPYLFESYVGHVQSMPEQSLQLKDGYINIGEYGRLDEQGYLYLIGRRSRRVNIADQLVHPEEIEMLLLQYGGIGHCAVVPIPDKKRGQVLIAVIELNEASQVNTDELLLFLRNKIGPLKSPRSIFVVESLPKLASGKIDLMVVDTLVSKYCDEKNAAG